MPKMYRIVGRGSYGWEYVDAKRTDGELDAEDVLLGTSTRTWETPEEVEAAIVEMKDAEVKRRDQSAK